jgi:hypothetical protein
MFESLMCRTWIKKIRKRKLGNVPETLKWARIKYLFLKGIQSYENVYRVAYFVQILGHDRPTIFALYSPSVKHESWMG